MIKEYSISIVLDKRRIKQDGTYSVKLRVFTPYPRKQKLYPLMNLTESDFENTWETQKPKKDFQDNRIKLQEYETKANKTANQLSDFNFEDFEKLMFKSIGITTKDVYFYFDRAIEQYKKNGQVGTADNYNYSLKAIKEFNKNKENLPFKIITPQWLKDFEYHQIKTKNNSQSTVGFYLRPLRAIFNSAIEDKIISIEKYPFGKRRFIIPKSKNIKKALSKNDLKILFEATPKNKEQEKAKDFWFFSYLCNGINVMDIANLKYEDLKDDKIFFKRIKTKNTSRADIKTITIFLTDFSSSIIEKYGNPLKISSDYIFTIIQKDDDETQIKAKVKNFTRFINQHIKNLAKANKITDEISTYYARHSFATMSILNGAKLEEVGELFGHADVKSTKDYFAGFTDETKRELSQKLMNFLT